MDSKVLMQYQSIINGEGVWEAQLLALDESTILCSNVVYLDAYAPAQDALAMATAYYTQHDVPLLPWTQTNTDCFESALANTRSHHE